MDILNNLLIIALGQGYILAFFLLSSKYYKSTANSWLAIAAIILSTTSILDIIGQNNPTDSILLEFFLNDIELGFLIYIPLYFYFRIIASGRTPNFKKDFYLLLPFLIDTIINIFLVTTYSLDEIIVSNRIQFFYEIEGILSLAYNLFLCFKSYQLINNSKEKDTKEDWIFKIWRSTFILLLLWIIVILSSLTASHIVLVVVTVLYFIVSIWIFWLIYNGVVNLNLIEDRKSISLKLKSKLAALETEIIEKEATEILIEDKVEPKEIVSQKANPKILNKHFDKINSLMQEEQLYQNEDLSVDDVAQKIGMSSGYISQIIKNATEKNFPTWINELRVIQVKEMLTDEEFNNYTALSIGLEAGFKSKSSFYTAFKKNTGVTPAKYRKIKS